MNQINRENGVTTGTILVKLVAAGVTILNTFVHNSYEVLDASTLHNHQVFDEETVPRIPPGMEDSSTRVQQIPQLFVIDFKERCFDVPLIMRGGHFFPHVPGGLEEQAVILIWSPAIIRQVLLHAHHGIGFARARLAISEHRCRVTLQGRVDQLINGARVEYLLLTGLLRQHCVEAKLLHALF